jgi:hypothetical protein
MDEVTYYIKGFPVFGIDPLSIDVRLLSEESLLVELAISDSWQRENLGDVVI